MTNDTTHPPISLEVMGTGNYHGINFDQSALGVRGLCSARPSRSLTEILSKGVDRAVGT